MTQADVSDEVRLGVERTAEFHVVPSKGQNKNNLSICGIASSPIIDSYDKSFAIWGTGLFHFMIPITSVGKL